jgi:8-oxo-dGTP pyrophosphatase MutT (NUDIX family)
MTGDDSEPAAHLPQAFAKVPPIDPVAWRASLPGKRMGAGALICDPAGRVLVVEPTYKESWEVPGGIVEADESPRQACAREIREELGLELAPGRLLVWEWQGPEPDRTESVMFIFDGGVLPDLDAVTLPVDELASARFVPPADLADLVAQRLLRRIHAALRALAAGALLELEHGHELPPTPPLWPHLTRHP